MKKRILSFFMALVICFSLLPTAAFAEIQPGPSGTALTSSVLGEDYTLGGGIYYLPDNLEINQTINISHDVTLDLNGKVLWMNSSIYEGTASGSVIKVDSGGKLTLKDSNTSAEHFFYSREGSDLWRWDSTAEGQTQPADTPDKTYQTVTGGVITGGSNANGGGIFIWDGNEGMTSEKAIVEMKGGSIIGCTANYGGGVYVGDNKAEFTMEKGNIAGCAASFEGGGVRVFGESTFKMSGGKIHHCNTPRLDPLNYGRGAGVCNRGTFEMSGGSIENCKVYTKDTTACENTTAQGGGGVYSCGTFTMKNGSEIKDCITEEGSGNGILIEGKTSSEQKILSEIMPKGTILTSGSQKVDLTENFCDNVKSILCLHESLDANGKCNDCQMNLVAKLVENGNTIFYETLADVQVALNANTAGIIYLLANTSGDLTLSCNGITLDINGKKLTGGISITGGDATINGSTNSKITGDVTVTGGYANLNSCIFDGDVKLSGGTVSINGGTYNKNMIIEGGTVSLKGGSFASISINNSEKKLIEILEDGYAFAKENGESVDNLNSSIFSNVHIITHNDHEDIGTDNKCDFCGKELVAKVKINDTTKYFLTFDSALENIQSGQTLTILKNISFNENLETSNKNFIIDLNGKKINSTNDKKLSIKSDGDVTLKDSAQGVTLGAIDCEIEVSGNMTVENAIALKIVTVKSGKLIVNDDAKFENLMITGGEVTLEGGSLKKIRVGDEKISNHNFLGQGKSFYRNTDSKWLKNTDLDVDFLENVSIKDTPIKSISVSGGGIYSYGDEIILTVTATKATSITSEPSIKWYTVKDSNKSEITGAASGSYSPQNLKAGTYNYICEVSLDDYTVQSENITVTVNKITPTGAPKYTVINTSGKKLSDAALVEEVNDVTTGGFSVLGNVKWVDEDGNALDPTTTVVTANTAYKWLFTPDDTDKYNTLTGNIVLYSVSTGGSSSTTITVPVSSDIGSVNVKAKVSKDGTATVEISDEQIKQVAADGSGTVKVDMSSLKDITSVRVPNHVVETTNKASDTGLTISMNNGSVSMDEIALSSVSTGKDITLTIKTVPVADLTEEQKKAVGDTANIGLVVDIDVFVGSEKQSEFNGGKLTISIPYTPKKGEDPSKLSVWFIRDDGTIENKGGYYDAEKGCFVFETEHLSRYLLVSINQQFSDVAADSYYAAAVKWAVSNNITDGIGGDKFGPDMNCNRAQIVTFLYRCAIAQGVDVSLGEDTNILSYKDALDIPEYAFEAFQWACGAGIIQGSDGKLMPTDDCTRAQIVTMLYRYEIANGMSAVTMRDYISAYGDSSDVPAYAVPAFNWALGKGIVKGANGNLMSKDICTRGQIVTMLYRLIEE